MAQPTRNSQRKSKRPDHADYMSDLSELSAHLQNLQLPDQQSPQSHHSGLPGNISQAVVPDLDKQLQFEQLKHENLKLQLELTKLQLDLAERSATPPSSTMAIAGINANPLQHVLASGANQAIASTPKPPVPSLADLRKSKNASGILPNEF